MKADEKQQPAPTTAPAEPADKNLLAVKLSALADQAKAGQLVSFRLLAAVVIVAVGGGLWWYLSKERGRAGAVGWQRVADETSATELEKLGKETALGTPAKVARLQLARIQLGPNGIAKLSNPEERKKAVESIDTARAEFAKLADEFKGDLTLRGQSLDGWAHAELALVGIPQEKDASVYRGDVAKAAELFKEFAQLVGPDTEVGKRAAAQADTLLKKKDEVLQVAKDLNSKLTPNVSAPDLKLPPGLNLPAPPAVPAPKAPDAPVTPPVGEKKADTPPPPAPEKK